MNNFLQEDTSFLIRHSMRKGSQALSLLTPSLYTVIILYRRGRQGFTLNRLLRATWIGSATGSAIGGGLAWTRLRSQSPDSLHDRRTRLRYNTTQIRTDDYSTIGMVLCGILTPALFWRKAQAVNLILGGGALGMGAGVVTHLAQSFSEGHDVKPEGMVDILEK